MTPKIRKIVSEIIIIAFAVALIGWVSMKFVHLGDVEFTDNAQIKQQIVPVNSRVQGFIREVRFEEYQPVKKGDILAVIDDVEYLHRLAQAEADCQNALAGREAMSKTILTAQNDIRVTESGLKEFQIRMNHAEKEYLRYKRLLEEDSVTRQQFENVKTEYEAAAARFEQVRRQKNSSALVESEQQIHLLQRDAGIKLAEAALDLAKLNLSYTVIVAPCDGITGRKNIEEGQLIQPGQLLLNIVDNEKIWVVANYKETQLANIQKGSKVEVTVDAVPGKVFEGSVVSISGSTGAGVSLFPQDNSAGNFVKIAQRVPVKIELAKQSNATALLLRNGLNAECEVRF